MDLNLTYLRDDMTEWFRTLHRHPEPAFEENFTSGYIASLLKTFGYEVHEGIGGTGIVALLRNGSGKKSIGLRADFDALQMQEDNDLPYKSETPGRAHLCGHDGHATMLLGAAKFLSDHRTFDGTLVLIFQPAEETQLGASAMMRDGLFEKFPVDAVFAMHNMPGLKAGSFCFHDGPTMSAVDNWDITLTGKAVHASMPEAGTDPVVAGAALLMGLQTIVSRNLSPWDNSVVTVGAFHAGTVPNSVPESATLRLSIRNMRNEDREMTLRRIEELTEYTAKAYGCSAEILKNVSGKALFNDPETTAFAASVAEKYFGSERVTYPGNKYMASEDFAFMLAEKKGTYLFIGNGDTPQPHNTAYVFNPEILPIGATYWVALVHEFLR